MNSIRGRVLTFSLLGSWTLILFSALFWYRMAEHILIRQFDEALGMRAGSLATLMHQTSTGLELEFADELIPEFMPGPDAEMFQIWTAAGSVVERSNSLVGEGLSYSVGALGRREFWDMQLPDGRAGRACRIAASVLLRESEDDDDSVPLATGPIVTIVVAKGRGSLNRALGTLWLSVLLVGALVAFGNLVLLFFFLTRGLAPLNRLGSEVASLDPSNLPDQLRCTAVRTEMEATVGGLNVLLHRIRSAIEREKRTASNIAHELLTPISELRSLTEVALKWPSKSDYVLEALRQSHAVSLQMDGITQTILTLARSEKGAMVRVDETIDVGAFMQTLAERYESAAELNCGRLDMDVEEGLMIRTDPAILDILMSNLMSNAVEHGPEGSRVLGAGRREGDDVVLTVSSPVADLELSDLAHLTEPFWRKDSARTGTQHTGLGLALAAELTSILDGELDFEIQGEVFMAILTLHDQC